MAASLSTPTRDALASDTRDALRELEPFLHEGFAEVWRRWGATLGYSRLAWALRFAEPSAPAPAPSVAGTAYDQWYKTGAPGEKLAPLFVYLNDQGGASLVHVHMARGLRFDSTPRVLVTVEDGVAVACSEEGVNVTVIDYDEHGLSEDETESLTLEGEEYRYTRSHAAPWDDAAEALWAKIDRDLAS